MKKTLLYIFAIMLVLTGCRSSKSASTVKVVKPKYHNRFYDPKKDKKAKRTSIVKMKG
jgi:PBP1b-binding outer membrane lipoprotein LpoB